MGLASGRWELGQGPLRRRSDRPNPTDRAKNGTKKSLLVDGEGGPLSLLVAPANVNDHLLLADTLDAVLAARPPVTPAQEQHLCSDGGYNNAPSRVVVTERGYRAHIRPGGVEAGALRAKQHKPRRWVVDRTFAWLSKCRGLVIRYEVRSENYLALLQLACPLLWYRPLPFTPS